MKKIILTAVVFMGLTATAQVKIGTDPTNLATDANLQVEGTTATEQFVVLKNGNVGIGTTTPNRSISVNSSAGAGVIQIFGTDTQNGIEIGRNNADRWYMGQEPTTNPSPNSFKIWGIHGGVGGLNGAALTIQHDTFNVGIFTQTPTAKLEVNGNMKLVTTPTITNATKVLVKEPVTNEISEQDINLGNMPVVNTTSTPALAGDVFVSPNGGGVILVSPDGLSKWKISVSNTGTLITTKTP